MSTKKLQIIGSLSSDGVYVGSGDMPDGYNVQIDPTGDDTYSLLPAVTADDNGKVAIVQNGEWTAAVMDAQSDITIDSELSTTSINPVQNKVVKSAIDNISTLIGDSSVSEQITNAIDLLDLSNTYIAASQKGAASGVAELDSSGKVPSSQLNAVTKSDIGLGNVDNTSDVSKPISTATQTALNNKVDKITGKSLSTNDYTTAEKTKLAGIEAGATKYTHPTGDGNLHVPATGTSNSGKVLKAGSTAGSISWGSLSKSDVGLGNVDNTSDANKPISTATQTALDAKQNTITGAATTITGNNLTASRALVSDSSGKVAVSDITATELGYLDGVTSNIQQQLNANSSLFVRGSGSNAIQGLNGMAQGKNSFAIGTGSMATDERGMAIGYGAVAGRNQFATGVFNKPTDGTAAILSTTGSVFVVGVGTSSSKTKNGFRVGMDASCYGAAAFKSSGADYAEYEEWLDGNPDNEDRRGLFVTYEGDKIRLANAEDDYIAGIVSAAPSVVGDVQSEEWQGRFLKDVFGAMVTETVKIEEVVDEDGNVIPAHTETRFVINPDYDPTREYVSREYRQEWDMVGYVGKLVVVDDGTCQVNGYCKPADGGIATASDKGYRVLKRIDETHIKVRI